MGFILLLIMLSPVSAGVGIVWSKESEVTTIGQRICIKYGVYNPFLKDVKVTLRGNLAPQEAGLDYLTAESEVKDVPAGTSSSKNVPVDLCFDVPKDVFEEDCLIGDFLLCEQKCVEKDVIYAGEVIATEVKDAGAGGTGSSAIALASVPFKLKVNCVEHGIDWTLLYIIIILLIFVAAALAYKFNQSHKGPKKRGKIIIRSPITRRNA